MRCGKRHMAADKQKHLTAAFHCDRLLHGDKFWGLTLRGKIMIDDITKISLLYDFYGAMLTKRQSEVIGLYYEENCSLSEIAEELGISRQGVYDALKNAQKSLREYEEKLGLVEKFTETGRAIAKIDKSIDSIIDEYAENRELKKKLTGIKKIIDKLDE